MTKPDPKKIAAGRAAALQLALDGNVDDALNLTAVLNMVTEQPIPQDPSDD